MKSTLLWMCIAVTSILANAFLLYVIVDSGATLTYTSVSLERAELERDIIATACNAALDGGTEPEILQTVSNLEQPWRKEPLGWIAGDVHFVFEDQRLKRLRYGNELEALEDALSK